MPTNSSFHSFDHFIINQYDRSGKTDSYHTAALSGGLTFRSAYLKNSRMPFLIKTISWNDREVNNVIQGTASS
jgi:hypothetical protein